MAKKAEVKKSTYTHKQCGFCMVIDYEFLNYKGEPIMGQCIWRNGRFLINEKVDCKKLWIPKDQKE
jgi:hypothetical protein